MTVNLQRRIARVDTDGTVSAIRQFGTSGHDHPFGIDIRDGVVYVSGMTEGALAGRAGASHSARTRQALQQRQFRRGSVRPDAHLPVRSLRPPAGRPDAEDRSDARERRAAAATRCVPDFLTQYTATFTIAYVFVVMEIASRRIVHVNVTTAPTLAWGTQQLRNATPWGTTPRFLVHDNDAIDGQSRPPVTGTRDGTTRRYRGHFNRWLDEALGIRGIPIPYGAPNASPYVERFMRTLRQDALDHSLFLSVAHLRRIVAPYVRDHNGARPSQAIHRIPAPYPELTMPPPANGQLVALPVLGGLQHDYRLAA